jgi:hypothetical protein
MELLLIAIYVGLCMAVFKIFSIPVNQWSLSTAALIGILGIFFLLLGMSYNHPFTTNARIYYAVTPIFPTVKGRAAAAPGPKDQAGPTVFVDSQSGPERATSPARSRSIG